MTVSRRVSVAFDAPDDETADWFANFLRRIVMGEQWGHFEDIRQLSPLLITGQAWSSEPAAEVSGGA